MELWFVRRGRIAEAYAAHELMRDWESHAAAAALRYLKYIWIFHEIIIITIIIVTILNIILCYVHAWNVFDAMMTYWETFHHKQRTTNIVHRRYYYYYFFIFFFIIITYYTIYEYNCSKHWQITEQTRKLVWYFILRSMIGKIFDQTHQVSFVHRKTPSNSTWSWAIFFRRQTNPKS